MKKNLKKVAMQKQKKPKIGKRYKIWINGGITLDNTMLILDVIGNLAVYTYYSESDIRAEWDYVKYSEHLNYELSSLEMELL